MYIPVRRSLVMVVGVCALVGPYSGTVQAQFRGPLAGGALSPVMGMGFGGFNPYVNPFAFGAVGGFGWGAGALYGRPYGGLGYGGLGYGAMGYGGLINNALAGAGWGYGVGMMMTQWMMNPYEGYLKGSADVTRSQAEYYQGIQQAKLTRQEAIRSSLETRRAMIEEAEWERNHMPDPEKIRQQAIQRELSRARTSPPLNDVWSARSLNALVRHLITQQADGLRGPRIALNEDIVKHINFQVGDSRANVGLLKNHGELDWPDSLQAGAFKEGREQLGALMRQAYKSVISGNNPDSAVLNDLKAQYDGLRKTLDNNIADLTPAEYFEANRYLKEIGHLITALQDPSIGRQFNDDWKPKVRFVHELVKYMREKGLLFAAATPNDESAYVALYHALAAFDAGMERVAGRGNAEGK